MMVAVVIGNNLKSVVVPIVIFVMQKITDQSSDSICTKYIPRIIE